MSVHSRLNAAYVYPEYTFAHELLTVAGVLGHLLQGRAAYISPPIARCIADVMATRIVRWRRRGGAYPAQFRRERGRRGLHRQGCRARQTGHHFAAAEIGADADRLGRLPLNRDFLQQVRNEL